MEHGGRIMVAAALASWVLAACVGPTPGTGQAQPFTPIAKLAPAALQPGERLQVVATTNIVADVVRSVGGDAIRLTGLVPAGADPHSYEPTPQDLKAVADAQLVFVNGLGLETFLAKLLESTGGRAPIVSLSEGLQPLAQVGSAETGPSGAAGVDQHVWFDPTNVVIWADNAGRALAAVDPGHASEYQHNAQVYQSQLRALDAWIAGQVSGLPLSSRKLVTDHEELGYFAARYSFQIVGAVIPAYSTAAEPSAQEISQLETAIRALGVKALFVGATVNPALSRRVAQDTGVSLVPLYTESLSGPDGPAASYLQFMQYNVEAIVAALR